MATVEKQSITPFPIAVIKSSFNQMVTDRLLQGAMQRLSEHGFTDKHTTLVTVPGAVEIPVVAQRLAQTKRYQALIALGAVIRGETSHYDTVCSQVSQGCQRVALDHEIPVIFGILTTDNTAQALARCGGEHGHKGREAVDTALAMVSVLQQLD